jgi:hypothetical protein
MLGMFYAESMVSIWIVFLGLIINRKDKIICPVTNGMNSDVQTSFIGTQYPFAQTICICNIEPGRGWIIPLGLVEPCCSGPQRSVYETL